MSRAKYPLKPVLEHRERKVDDATAELGEAIQARESAEAARVRAEADRVNAVERATEIQRLEDEMLDRGELRVVDLARGDAWAYGAQVEIDKLVDVETTAETKLDTRMSEEESARAELAQKLADRDVVRKDESRFLEKLRQKQIASEEEAAEEARRR